MAIKGSSLRIGGLNSGLDTEAIVNAMTANTKLRITTNQRKVLKLQAQQEAYRSIIDKFNGFKEKYLNSLNGSTWLNSSSTFNRHKATIFDANGVESTPRGISVSTNANAVPGDYSVTVNKAAKQATFESTSMDLINAGNIEVGNLKENSTYLMYVSAGGVSKQIVFQGGDTSAKTLENINEQLIEAFGSANKTDETGTGLVFATIDADGLLKLGSTDRRAISTSPAVELTEQLNLDFSDGWKTGDNAITIMINGDHQTVTFQTLAEDYFDGFQITADADGKYSIVPKTATADDLTDEQKALSAAEQETLIKNLQSEYNSRVSVLNDILSGIYADERTVAFEGWKDGQGADYNADYKKTTGDLNAILDSMSAEQKQLFADEVVRRNELTNQQEYDRALSKAYDDFDKWQRANIGASIVNGNANPDYLYFEDWRDNVMGLGKDAPALGSSQKWEDLVPNAADMKAGIQKFVTEKGTTNSKWNAVLSNTKADTELTKLSTDAALAFKSGEKNVGDGQIDEFAFIRGAYDEQTAFNARYSADETNGTTYNDFLGKISGGANANIEQYVHLFNEKTIEQKLGSVTFADGTKVSVEIAKDGDGKITNIKLTAKNKDDDVLIGAFVSEKSANDFGLEVAKSTASAITISTRLSELGLDADDDGKYNIEINGVKFSFESTATVNQMMSSINSSAKAGVKMSFSTITNTFELKSNEYGTGASITVKGDEQGLFERLGFDTAYLSGEAVRNGENMTLSIDGEEIETSSNSYQFNGTTITVDPTVSTPVSFDISVRRDTSAVFDMIKDFMKDYNDLVDYVYGYVNEKPDSEYYFLTDDDKEELGLTESQEKKWEEKAKQGLLYNDQVLNGIMTKIRTALFAGVSRGDGTSFSLFSMGISTSSNYRDNGKLVFDELVREDGLTGEDRLRKAIENDIDMISELFTNPETGLAVQLNKLIDSAVSTSGDRSQKGLLVQRAGVANTTSVTDNAIYDQIMSLNRTIGVLEARYDKQQDRYWKIFSALEQQMGQLNAQTDYINQFMGSMQQR